MTQINPLNSPLGPVGPTPSSPAATPGPTGSPGFSAVLMDSIEQVNRLQAEAAEATRRFAAGQTTNIAEVMLAVQKADIAYSMLMEIKNKLMEAYQEIQQMRI